MPRLMSFAKTRVAFEMGWKDVTRRDGWLFLKAGDVIEGIEWSTRVGARWVCSCGSLGSTKKNLTGPRCSDYPSCHGEQFYRAPKSLGLRRVKSVRRERLGDITSADVEREGFRGKSPEWFVAMYCAPDKPDPDRVVTRIELERL